MRPTEDDTIKLPVTNQLWIRTTMQEIQPALLQESDFEYKEKAKRMHFRSIRLLIQKRNFEILIFNGILQL